MSLLRAATVAVLVANFFLSTSGWADVLITDVIGKPGLVSKPPLAILNEVVNGSLVEAPAGLQFTAIDLVTGKEYLASGPGQFRIASAGVLSLTTGTVKVRSVADGSLPDVRIATGKLSRASMTMRTLLVKLPMYPSNTAIPDTTPTLRWAHMAGASSYRVTVSDDTNRAIWQRNTTEAQLALIPDSGLRLGNQYTWKVEPLNQTGDPVSNATSAGFFVVAEDAARVLAAIKPEPGASFSAWVLYAAQLQQAGATDDAQTIWQALARERPGDLNLKKLVK
ncbi:hypothetical protein [Candidatus Aalborgicola defluviihabitans]|jgi:hypothetical protein|uniref:hypothetical protein n=1 Tax=Candidatus Aalborgicola defluviihabitans TaxID=3386187 RepID=UPI001D20B272|nr:hypothetical protein [Burkholderiales bacterium]MBK7312671.1 hypothetical protein [Burkholderiales bacterium]